MSNFFYHIHKAELKECVRVKEIKVLKKKKIYISPWGIGIGRLRTRPYPWKTQSCQDTNFFGRRVVKQNKLPVERNIFPESVHGS